MFMLEETSYERPNGRFIGGFYWMQPYGLADYEEEWGKKWLDGFDYEFAVRNPFYDKTGNIRPFADIEELNSRKLRAADRKADKTWNTVEWKIKNLIFEDAVNYPENIIISTKELAWLLESYEEGWE